MSSTPTSWPSSSFLRTSSAHELEQIDPGLDGIDVGGVFAKLDSAGPAIETGIDARHRRLTPLRIIEAAIEDDGREHVVALAEDIGADLDDVADFPLHRVAAVIDLWRDILNDDGATTQPGGQILGHRPREMRCSIARLRRHGVPPALGLILGGHKFDRPERRLTSTPLVPGARTAA